MLGSVQDNPQKNRPPKTLALPFVYALLSSKQQVQYSAVLNPINDAANEFDIELCYPDKFEIAIINASSEIFPESDISCCYFYFKQALYRSVQRLGLQIPYNDPNDPEDKVYIHMFAALAFVPVENVSNAFRQLKNSSPACLHDFIQYFETTYVGVTARGRRPAQEPWYAIDLWNQYSAKIGEEDTTNNVSEGWHNRFRLVVGKHHPDLYSALKEFQKEQGDTEVKFC